MRRGIVVKKDSDVCINVRIKNYWEQPYWALFLFGLLLSSCGGAGSSRNPVSVADTIPVENYSEPTDTTSKVRIDNHLINNIISDSTNSLQAIYEKLYQLKSAKNSAKTTLSIVHIGDSHLQAGFLNGTVMKLLQSEFGNAGRGLIFPLKLAKTNEPTDYFIESTEKWSVSRCVSRRMAFPVGLGGLSIMTSQSDFALHVGAKDQDSLDYKFNRIKIFHHPKTPEFKVSGVSGAETIRDVQTSFVTEFVFPSYIQSLDLVSESAQPGDSSIIYGFSLERSDPGVIYHAIGINSAQFSSYLRIARFTSQINELHPDLIIFSLGTNEAFNDAFNRTTFSRSVDRLVSSLVREIPQAKVIISTPAECQRCYAKYDDEFRPNELIPEVGQALIEYAKKSGYPYWDLFNITGGKNSSQWWIKQNYLANDRIHFYVSGYKYQGKLLYQALINGYNDYVSNRSR